MDKLFYFTHPTRDVSRLCAREGFEPPVARLISETGRLSRTPVFIVGVFSGTDKLGEGAGASLDEARIRAAAATLRSWYLYSPPAEDVVLPSEIGTEAGKKKWRPHMVDPGEIIV
jgi:dsRNA-specific ribonuclease